VRIFGEEYPASIAEGPERSSAVGIFKKFFHAFQLPKSVLSDQDHWPRIHQDISPLFTIPVVVVATGQPGTVPDKQFSNNLLRRASALRATSH
jgi:hypothetical protein